ncbi:MAG: PKD domain-containing protein [Gammaproteobacteria bacterium]|nr:MAG: PKD domain-containing protein [Gammaproteobacteria bacterium]
MSFRKCKATGILMSLSLCAFAQAAGPAGTSVSAGVQIGEPVSAVSIDVDLRDLPVAPAWKPGMAIKEAHKRQFFAPNRPNAALPSWIETSPDRLPELQSMWDDSAVGQLRRGQPQSRVSINNASTGVSPGDPVVDVSANYIMYGVNGSSGTSFTIYDKTGTKLAGPTTFSSLAPAGDGCRTSVSDPIILFDRLANRWFLLEMGGTSSAAKMCIYVSKTENPVSGGWWFYGFSTPALNDYPHCGVWNNAYVCTDNEGGSNVAVYAYDRANMLSGATARAQQRFATVPALAGYGFQALTPATFMGDSAHAPPASTRQVLVRHNDDEAHAGGSANTSQDYIDIYTINIDWNTPSNSAITAQPDIAITEFNSWFRDYSTFATVPQPGSTSRLDPIREVILNSLVYRNLGSYESIVGQFATNQNAARSGTVVDSGIRWFELRRTGGGNWTLQQEGTYSPGDTSTHHLLGTIATDNKGNIALGFNKTRTTSPTAYASLGYTGRMASDAAGVMTLGENMIVSGSAAETSGRWGDYYQMAVDPTDDCTFWMVGMYRPSGSWNTRIQDFKFSDCGTAPSTWSVSGTVSTSTGVGISGVTVSNGSVSTTTNSSGAYTLSSLANGSYTLTPSLGGYTFSPTSRNVTVSGANVTGQNFTGTAASNIPPTAGFGFASNGLTTTFTDASSDSDGTIASRSWNFGDGGSSTATNPSHSYASAGSYSVTLTVTDNGGASDSETKTVTVTDSGNVLQNGVTVSGLAATQGNSLNYTMQVPAGASGLTFNMSGGSGDADLYVRFGAAPTDTVYDCRPYASGNTESCPISTAQAGTYYVRIKAYSTFSGVSLTGSYTLVGNVAPNADFSSTSSGLTANFTDASSDSDGSIVSRAWNFGDGSTSTSTNPSHAYASAGTYSVSLTVTDDDGATDSVTKSVTVSSSNCVPSGTVLCNGSTVSGLSATRNNWTSTYTLVVPAGATNLSFNISGGTGDADLYVRLGAAPTTSSYLCRPYTSGNSETCSFAAPTPGTYYVRLRAYATFSGVTLTTSYTP